jgi:hypothetical protein
MAATDDLVGAARDPVDVLELHGFLEPRTLLHLQRMLWPIEGRTGFALLTVRCCLPV